MKNLVLHMFIVAMLLGGCARTHSEHGLNSEYTSPISLENIRINMEFLAADELEGRDTGTRGEELAALYLKSEMKKYGIGVLDELSGYYQKVPLTKSVFARSSFISIVDMNGKESVELEYPGDFVGSSQTFPDLDTTASMVFAGYGISAEEYQYDDYKSLDVTNKIVLIWPGEPASDDTAFFAGEKETKHSSLFKKVATAKKHGALGIFLVSMTEQKYGWDTIREYTSKGSMAIRGQVKSEDINRRMPRVYLKSASLKRILDTDQYAYDHIAEKLSAGDSIPRFEMQNRVRLKFGFVPDTSISANNVIGYFEGNDPQLKNEIVALGAHYDHVGQSTKGIYNGADDNASGTVATLEVAKAVAMNKELKRSVLFIFHTGEEKGLLGSKFLTKNLDAVENIVAYVNLDMVGRGPTDSIYIIGADRLSTEFSDIVEQANGESAGFIFDYSFNEPDDPNRFYYRSDHYSYAKQGIPVVFFFDYMKEDYHKVTDTADKINYEKLAKISDLSYHILKLTANRDSRPEVDKPISLNQN